MFIRVHSWLRPDLALQQIDLVFAGAAVTLRQHPGRVQETERAGAGTARPLKRSVDKTWGRGRPRPRVERALVQHPSGCMTKMFTQSALPGFSHKKYLVNPATVLLLLAFSACF